MPRGNANSAAVHEPEEPEKPVDMEEQVDFDGDNDPEEEEIEYEEVEEEVEEDEEEEEEEEEVVEEEHGDANGADAAKVHETDLEMNGAKDDEDSKEHAELLALPPQGSEVYVGGLPADVSKEDLKSFCESVGEVTEVRMMKAKDSRENRGYAFVTFRNKELATKAIKELNNTQFKDKKIKCSDSQAKNQLFIGNIPRTWGEDELKKVLIDVGPGVNVVELLKDPKNSSRNRGFAFIGYYNHACAEYSKAKMSKPKFKLDDNVPTVSWADPKNSDSSASSQVKVIYVKNLPKNTSQSQLRKLFEEHGEITKIVLPPGKSGQEKSRFGFIYFAERSSAMKALENPDNYEIDGQAIECSLAKPQVEGKSTTGSSSQKSAQHSSYLPHMGYGLVGGGYGGGYGSPGLMQQPLIYGRGPTPAGMAMMPMLLPNGQIGYVLQQPGAQQFAPPLPQRDGRSNWSSSGGRHNNSDSSRGRRYHPY